MHFATIAIIQKLVAVCCVADGVAIAVGPCAGHGRHAVRDGRRIKTAPLGFSGAPAPRAVPISLRPPFVPTLTCSPTGEFFFNPFSPPPTVVIPGLGAVAGIDSYDFPDDVVAFLGIPYGKPPVDGLRWQPPLPYGAFPTPGPLQAATFGYGSSFAVTRVVPVLWGPCDGWTDRPCHTRTARPRSRLARGAQTRRGA